MNIQKIQASQNVKGFTLVELIVVITILAILGTIAFLSLQGQSAAARDSKRKTDLGSLATKLTITQANGTSLLAMVTGGGTSTRMPTTAYIAGGQVGAVGAGIYDAGTPNYVVLGITPTDFKDPKGQDYKVGATTLVGGAFQLAATLEADNAGNTTPNALVEGTYNPRLAVATAATYTPTIISGTNNLSFVISGTPADIGKFRTGDTVTIAGTTGCTTPKIGNISSDLGTLTVTCAATPTPVANSSVTLAQPEMLGLVGSGGTSPTVAVVNGATSSLAY